MSVSLNRLVVLCALDAELDEVVAALDVERAEVDGAEAEDCLHLACCA